MQGLDLGALIRGRCPRCRKASIFKPGLPGLIGDMRDNCPVCGLVFLREAGYFLGAMYVSYGLGVTAVLPVAIVLALVVEWPLWAVMTVMFAQTLVLMPLIFRYSRVIWLHVDQAIDPR
jgi:uncharacterized protein (DUF983 family)